MFKTVAKKNPLSCEINVSPPFCFSQKITSALKTIIICRYTGDFYLEGEFGHVVHGDRDDDDAQDSDDQTGAVNRFVNASYVRGVRVDGVKTENRHRKRDYNVTVMVKVSETRSRSNDFKVKINITQNDLCYNN